MQLGEEQHFEDKHILVQRFGGEGACSPRRTHILEDPHVSIVLVHERRSIANLYCKRAGVLRPRARRNFGKLAVAVEPGLTHQADRTHVQDLHQCVHPGRVRAQL